MTTVFAMFTIIGGAFDPNLAWVTPGTEQALLLILTGVTGGFAQIFLTESYRRAPASTVAPFDYTAMLFALFFGYVIFGDVPAMLMLVGAAIVCGAGIFVILRERQLGIDRARQNEAGTGRPL
jgi:drug/metabolite transporter (DMT)-like permease